MHICYNTKIHIAMLNTSKQISRSCTEWEWNVAARKGLSTRSLSTSHHTSEQHFEVEELNNEKVF